MAEAMSRSFEDVLQRAEQLIGQSAEFDRRISSAAAGPSTAAAAASPSAYFSAYRHGQPSHSYSQPSRPAAATVPTEPVAIDRWAGGGGGTRSPDIAEEVLHLSRALQLGGGRQEDRHNGRSLDDIPLQGSPQVERAGNPSNPFVAAYDGDWPPEKPPQASPWAPQQPGMPALGVRTTLSGGGSTPTFTNPRAPAGLPSEHLSSGGALPRPERNSADTRPDDSDTRSGAEVAVLIDGLERENTLLRQQIDRCLARERALRQESADLRNQLNDQEVSAKRKQEVEQASLLTAFHRQGEGLELASARLEALQKTKSSVEQELASLRAQVSMAQADMDKLVADLEGLLLFVLPSGRAPSSASRAEGAFAFPLQASMSRARKHVKSLRLACEAKLDTFGQLQGQMRQRLEEALAGQTLLSVTQPANFNSQAWARIGTAHSATEGAAAAAAQAAESVQEAHSAWVEEEAKLRCELRQAKHELSELGLESSKMVHQIQSQTNENSALAKELQDTQQALRIRDRELKEMQLLGKYFPSRTRPLEASEVQVASLAEDLRARCERLETELKVARADQDLRRLERSRAGGGENGG